MQRRQRSPQPVAQGRPRSHRHTGAPASPSCDADAAADEGTPRVDGGLRWERGLAASRSRQATAVGRSRHAGMQPNAIGHNALHIGGVAAAVAPHGSHAGWPQRQGLHRLCMRRCLARCIVGIAIGCTMIQSRQALAVALQGSRRIVAWAGLSVRSRDLSISSCLQHVQPVPADDPAPSPVEPAGKALWQQELGVIRTNWT